ncbi:hypothetical protein VTK26DRAFT_745 [Humicola hyalothermophila]
MLGPRAPLSFPRSFYGKTRGLLVGFERHSSARKDSPPYYASSISSYTLLTAMGSSQVVPSCPDTFLCSVDGSITIPPGRSSRGRLQPRRPVERSFATAWPGKKGLSGSHGFAIGCPISTARSMGCFGSLLPMQASASGIPRLMRPCCSLPQRPWLEAEPGL